MGFRHRKPLPHGKGGLDNGEDSAEDSENGHLVDEVEAEAMATDEIDDGPRALLGKSEYLPCLTALAAMLATGKCSEQEITS